MYGRGKSLHLMGLLEFFTHRSSHTAHVCEALRLPRPQACDGDRCSVVDVDAALARAPSALLDPAAVVASLPERFCSPLQAPLWRRTQARGGASPVFVS